MNKKFSIFLLLLILPRPFQKTKNNTPFYASRLRSPDELVPCFFSFFLLLPSILSTPLYMVMLFCVNCYIITLLWMSKRSRACCRCLWGDDIVGSILWFAIYGLFAHWFWFSCIASGVFFLFFFFSFLFFFIFIWLHLQVHIPYDTSLLVPWPT